MLSGAKQQEPLRNINKKFQRRDPYVLFNTFLFYVFTALPSRVPGLIGDQAEKAETA